jgi:hypothetical protein
MAAEPTRRTPDNDAAEYVFSAAGAALHYVDKELPELRRIGRTS